MPMRNALYSCAESADSSTPGASSLLSLALEPPAAPDAAALAAFFSALAWSFIRRLSSFLLRLGSSRGGSSSDAEAMAQGDDPPK